MRRGKLVVYRKCACGETAHDYTGRQNTDGYLLYACRNCYRERAPKDARSLRIVGKPAMRAA